MRPSCASRQQTSSINQLTRLSQLSLSLSPSLSYSPVFENQFRVVICLGPNLLTSFIRLMYTHIYTYNICLIFFYLIDDFSFAFISCLHVCLTFLLLYLSVATDVCDGADNQRIGDLLFVPKHLRMRQDLARRRHFYVS